MPVKRTIAQLFNLFAPGQSAGSITPDRVQDVIETIRGGWGRLSLSAQATTVITTQSAWVKAAGSTALAADVWQFDMPQDNRLRYTGIVPSRVEVTAAVNISDGQNKTIEIGLYRNGVLLTETVRQARLSGSGAIEGVVLLADFDAVTNDYVEIWMRNITDTSDVAVSRLYIRARSYVI